MIKDWCQLFQYFFCLFSIYDTNNFPCWNSTKKMPHKWSKKKRTSFTTFFKGKYARKSFNLLSQAHTISVTEIRIKKIKLTKEKRAPEQWEPQRELYTRSPLGGNTNYFWTFLTFISMYACLLSFWNSIFLIKFLIQ